MSLEVLLTLWNKMQYSMQGVYDTMSSTFSELMTSDVPIIQTVLNKIINSMGNLADWTILDCMIGFGLPLVVMFSITKWVLDIIP